jgi:hypothetical protein
MRSKTPLITALTLAVLAMAPAAAGASSNQVAIFQDDHELLELGDANREQTLDELRGLGVDVIKAELAWADVAPRAKRKPKGFDGSDPAEYPGWARFDALVRDAQARGFQVMLALAPPYPGWATKRRGDLASSYHPNAGEYGRFAEAAARRFPSVEIWTIGNEPNHPGFLFPQSTRGGVPFAPHAYRGMVRSAVAGLNRGGSGGDTILFGELLPIGKEGVGPKQNLKPLRFLREFFCLDSSYHPFRGRAARIRGCQRFKRLTDLDGFGYHPYTRAGGPRQVATASDDATISSYGRVLRTLDKARSKGRLGGARTPIWNTEFGFQSNPPDPFLGAKLARIPEFLAESELWLSLRNRRVASYSQFTMRDTPGNPGLWQGGLRFANGKPKRGVYDAYRLPIFARLLGPSAVEIWGDARPTGAGSVVQVQERLGRSGFHDLGGPISVNNVRGYFRARFQISNASKRSYRFVVGGLESRASKAVFRRQ